MRIERANDRKREREQAMEVCLSFSFFPSFFYYLFLKDSVTESLLTEEEKEKKGMITDDFSQRYSEIEKQINNNTCTYVHLNGIFYSLL